MPTKNSPKTHQTQYYQGDSLPKITFWGRNSGLKLTKQQAKVAELVLRAAGDKKVAYELGLGLPTVRTHLHRIYEKVGVADRAELIIRIINHARGNET